MLDPADLYDLDSDLAESLPSQELVLLHQLTGFVDAGQAGRLLTDHILDTCEHLPLAVFDHDQLHDYRSRRPTMVFDANQWKSVEEISLILHLVTGAEGEFLLLAGPEPDTQWDRYCAALLQILDQVPVSITMSAYGIPMAAPHTRPLTMTAHATDSELVNNYRSWIDRIEVPGSLTNLLQYRLGQAGRKALGFAVHVPHYLSQAEFPTAAVDLATAIAAAGGPLVDLTTLTEAAATTMARIEEEMHGSGEVTELVHNLERVYDKVAAGEADLTVPSADELGAEFERYLAAQETRPDPGEGFGEGGLGEGGRGDDGSGREG